MAERAKYTMRDVARLAGVSTSTVSAVMNGTVPVSSDRKARVQAAMTALDYQPDAIARSLKTGKSNAVGIIVPDITNAFYPEVVRELKRRHSWPDIRCFYAIRTKIIRLKSATFLPFSLGASTAFYWLAASIPARMKWSPDVASPWSISIDYHRLPEPTPSARTTCGRDNWRLNT